MLKVYTKENYKDWNEFEDATLEEVRNSFKGHDANYKGFELTINEFEFATVYFDAKPEKVIKVYLGDDSYLIFRRAVDSGTLNLNEEDKCTYNKIKVVVDDAFDTHKVELAEEAKRLEAEVKKAQEEAKKAAEEKAKLLEAKKQEERYRARIDRALKKLSEMKPEKTQKLFNSPTNYYECLGWMAKHATSIRPSMPDYMEKWFDGLFDASNKNVVDSKKRTANGNPMQWGLSFRMSFNEEVSGVLEARATSQNKKVIDSVSFVWDLIENYGFQFTKGSQDIEKIRAEIPNDYLSDFEKGLAM